MARHYGFQVDSITLHFLGGMTAIEGEARTPRQEFWIAVVGPLTSIAVGAAALGLWFVTPDGLLRMAVEGLAGANLLVGVLNLVPGLPLDGGRVLKAAVWGATGSAAHRDHRRPGGAAGWSPYSRSAGRCAQETLLDTPPDVLDFVLSFVIAAFLWSGASAAMTSARVRRRLPALVARDLARRTLAVPGDLPLAEAVRRAQEAEAGGIVTVTSGGQPGRRRQRGGAARDPRGPPAVGAGVHGGAHPRRRAAAAGRHHGRGPGPGDQRRPRRRSTSWSRTTARSTACSPTADVDRAFREA